MDHLNDKVCYGVILLFGLIGVSFNRVIRPRDLTLGTENRNWMNADKACQTDGLQLLSSLTKDNMVDILTLMNLWKDDGLLLSSVWVGLTRHKGELGFKSDSCSEALPNDQLPWLSGHPVATTQEQCVIIDKLSLKLKMTSCYGQYQYICEKPRDKCWFDPHLMQEATDSKMTLGTFSKEGCEDQCRDFVMGSQECVLIEIKGDECFIVLSDKQYIDDTPPLKSSYAFVEVKRCLKRSHRESAWVHVGFLSLQAREPCPSPSSSFLPSSDSQYMIYSSPVSVSLFEVSSYMKTSSDYDTDIYLSTSESNVLSSTDGNVLLSTESNVMSSTESNVLSSTEGNVLSSTKITDIYLSSTESNVLSLTEGNVLSSTESNVLSSTESNVLSSTEITDLYLSSTKSNVLTSTEGNVLSLTERNVLSSTESNVLSSTDGNVLSSIESNVLSSTENNVLSSTEITDVYLSSTESNVFLSTESNQTELHTPLGNLNTDSELIVQTLDSITLSFDTTIADYYSDSIETSLPASDDAFDTWTTSVTVSSSSIVTPSSLSPSIPFTPTSIVMDTDITPPTVTSAIPYQSKTNPTFSSLCRCVCLKNNSSVHGLSHTKLAEIRKKLFVDTSTLSSTRRKLTSAEDHRPSAIITGQLGLVVLILVFVFFLILDSQRFIVAIYELMKKKCTKTVVP